MIQAPVGAECRAIDRPSGICDPIERLRTEYAAFEALTEGRERLYLWQPARALMVTAAESGMANFAAAAEQAHRRGWAVHARLSGGGAVCLGPGVLVVSHLYHAARNDLDACYRRFAQTLICGIAALGVALDVEEVARAYCNGRFDLAWRGLKVGGMAQRRRMRAGCVAVWIHAVLSVESESARYPDEVSRLYADLGSPRVADSAATTSLSRCFASGAPPLLLERCAESIAGAFESRMTVGAT